MTNMAYNNIVSGRQCIRISDFRDNSLTNLEIKNNNNNNNKKHRYPPPTERRRRIEGYGDAAILFDVYKTTTTPI